MKKDMGGAACALGLASMLMSQNAPIQLRVLLPCVENSVDALSYRPGDVLRSRKDSRSRSAIRMPKDALILADALAEADAEAPDPVDRSGDTHGRRQDRAGTRAAGCLQSG